MSRAWRRPVTVAEVDQKLALFTQIRPACSSFQEAILEVLATVLSSPKFLYLVNSDQPHGDNGDTTVERLSDSELATRLSMFLWCSTPDDELLELAAKGQLSDRDVLASQVKRLLADPRSRRFSQQFVRQWLGMQLLDYLHVDATIYPQFDPALKDAMQQEPIAFFQEVLHNNHSVLDFLHANYTMANERLANHYELSHVDGNHFRRGARSESTSRRIADPSRSAGHEFGRQRFASAQTRHLDSQKSLKRSATTATASRSRDRSC